MLKEFQRERSTCSRWNYWAQIGIVIGSLPCGGFMKSYTDPAEVADTVAEDDPSTVERSAPEPPAGSVGPCPASQRRREAARELRDG